MSTREEQISHLSCAGSSFDGEIEYPACNSTGWKSGRDESLSRLKEWRDQR